MVQQNGGGTVERVGHYQMFDRDLFALAIAQPDDLPTMLDLPCPYFACLIAWDATGVSIEAALPVARRLIRTGCVYLCCWGPGCDTIEVACDLAWMEVHPDEPFGPVCLTTAHANESLSEALWFLLNCACPDDVYFDGCRAAMAVSIGSPTWAAELRGALSDPGGFSARVLAAK